MTGLWTRTKRQSLLCASSLVSGTGSLRCPNRIAGTLYRAIIILAGGSWRAIVYGAVQYSIQLSWHCASHPFSTCQSAGPNFGENSHTPFCSQSYQDPPPALTPSASDVQGSLPGPSMSPSLLRKGKQPLTSAPFTSFSRAGPSNQPKRARLPVESIDISLDLCSSQTAHSTTGWSSITGASGDSSASKDIEDVL